MLQSTTGDLHPEIHWKFTSVWIFLSTEVDVDKISSVNMQRMSLKQTHNVDFKLRFLCQTADWMVRSS